MAAIGGKFVVPPFKTSPTGVKVKRESPMTVRPLLDGKGPTAMKVETARSTV
ncbi:hypothetical protein [Haloarchaeobius sp. HME9146]|uniref:hypothetical protein n=1 Tax=Haloarchaeobius sp. HME9146 TaxID=2978732 RepID=UPI0021C170B9|nr:hypothetical protein [Haloarchaeobius sp. HME9146]MCT9094807.1 hypothetical protein [Haloarchaeobius sp. HME9146]